MMAATSPDGGNFAGETVVAHLRKARIGPMIRIVIDGAKPLLKFGERRDQQPERRSKRT